MGYQDLAYAIVQQAVEDYRYSAEPDVSIKELRRFFRSKWCKRLLADSELTGEQILDILESEHCVGC